MHASVPASCKSHGTHLVSHSRPCEILINETRHERERERELKGGKICVFYLSSSPPTPNCPLAENDCSEKSESVIPFELLDSRPFCRKHIMVRHETVEPTAVGKVQRRYYHILTIKLILQRLLQRCSHPWAHTLRYTSDATQPLLAQSEIRFQALNFLRSRR